MFFSTDEAIVAGRKAGILTDAAKKNIPNYGDVADWAKTVKPQGAGDLLPGVPYTLIAYVLAFNPECREAAGDELGRSRGVRSSPGSWRSPRRCTA